MTATTTSDPPTATFNSTFLATLSTLAKFKQRSHDTHHNIHIGELNARLSLGLDIPPPSPTPNDDPFALPPNLTNTSKIEVVLLGNSMLERFKTTGKATNLGRLKSAWNAGCGGDKNENVLYRLEQGLFDILEDSQECGKCDINLWILASGTNNLHPKRAFRQQDIDNWKCLVEACLRIAPKSKVLVCDLLYRQDVPGWVVDQSNEKLKEEVPGLIKRSRGEERIKWVEARHLVGEEMLVDHVHLNEEGYETWDGVLWPYVVEVLELEKK